MKSLLRDASTTESQRFKSYLTKISLFFPSFILSKTVLKCGFSSKYFAGSLATILWNSPLMCVPVMD